MHRRSLRRVIRVSAQYVHRSTLRGYLGAARLIRSIWGLGWGERVSLFATLVVVVLAGVTRTSSGVIPTNVLVACQAVSFVLAWSLTAAMASQRHPLTLVSVAPWLIFYVVLVSGPVIGTLWASLPLLWLAAVLCVSLGRIRHHLFEFLALWTVSICLISYPLPGVSGLRHSLGWSLGITRVFVGVLLFLGGVWSAHRRVMVSAKPPRFGFVLAGSVMVSTAVVGLSLWRDPSLTVSWIATVFDDASALVALAFMWTAGRFAEGAFGLTNWTLRHVFRWVPSSSRVVGAVGMIAGVTLFDFFRVLSARPDELAWFATAAQGMVGGLSIVVCLWWWRQRVLTPQRALTVATSWAVACAAIQSFQSFAAATVQSAHSSVQLTAVSLLITIGGLAFEISKWVRLKPGADPSRLYLVLGVTSVASLSALSLLLTAGSAWSMRRSLMILTGALHLGLPLAVARARRWSVTRRTPTTPSTLGFFAAGYGVALVALIINPWHAATLLVGVPALGVLLSVWSRHQSKVDPDHGALLGAMFGGGMVAGWMMPYPPTIPFLPRSPLIDLLRDWGALGRPPLTAAHLALLVSAWVIGASMGWSWVRRDQAARRAGRLGPTSSPA